MERVAGSVPLTREMGRFYRFVDGGKAVDRVDRDAWPVFHPVRIETIRGERSKRMISAMNLYGF